jgi:flagellar motor switch protein FliG
VKVTNPLNDGLRKAAILVASLDTAAADALLDQFTDKQAQQVRDLVMEMGEIDHREQQRVIEEFRRVGPRAQVKGLPGIELDGELARRIVEYSDSRRDDAQTSEGAEPSGRPFQFLQETEAEKLARVLAGERPQTIALVLSHLPPGRAGAVLACLQAGLQVEVVRRLVDLEETDPQILRAVEEALQSRLSEKVPLERRRVAGFQAVLSILDASDGGAGTKILDNLAVHDRSLAERLVPQPHPLDFDDLVDLDDGVLIEAFATAEQELVVPALLGASPKLVERVLRLLPIGTAETLREQLDHPGPIRLRDVEEARRELAWIAQRMNYGTSRRVAA